MNDLNPKSPPHDADAERSLLGAILLDAEHNSDTIASMSPEEFYIPDHRRIFAAIRSLADDAQPIDAVLCHDRLKATGSTIPAEFVVYLLESVPSAAHASEYREIVREKFLKRRTIEAASEIIAQGYNGVPAMQTIAEAGERFLNLAGDRTTTVTSMEDGLDSVFKHWALMKSGHDDGSIASPWIDLDVRFYPEELTIIAARPSMGKTSFMLNLASRWAQNGINGAFFSLETPMRVVFANILSLDAGLSPNIFRRGAAMSEELLRKMHAATDRLSGSELHVVDASSLSISEFRNQCRELKRKHDIKWVAVDYLQLMTGPESERRDLEVGAISRGLKLLARELKIPVIALAQLSRLSERRGKSRRPMLSDLRDSGSIEQDADTVLLLHREAYYEPGEEDDGTTEIIIAKQRNGPTGEAKLKFLKSCLRFEQCELGEGR